MISPNTQDDYIFSVEGVESVEVNDNYSTFNELEVLNPSTEFCVNHVEFVGKIDLADYFSRLSTVIKARSVGVTQSDTPLISSELESTPRLSLIPQEKDNDSARFRNFDHAKVSLVTEWIQIVADEGHIEPSQPSVGRILGWPVRSCSIQLLYVDFFVWCWRKGLRDWDIPEKTLHFTLLDSVFVRIGDQYEFPPLDTCRKKFQDLKELL